MKKLIILLTIVFLSAPLFAQNQSIEELKAIAEKNFKDIKTSTEKSASDIKALGEKKVNDAKAEAEKKILDAKLEAMKALDTTQTVPGTVATPSQGTSVATPVSDKTKKVETTLKPVKKVKTSAKAKVTKAPTATNKAIGKKK